MLYRISVTERGLTGIANIFRSRLSRLDDLLGAGTAHRKQLQGLVGRAGRTSCSSAGAPLASPQVIPASC